ncbi:MAG: DUF1848 domain-containing protein [bacterium]|nr:DUF1848 domain-containing protein [bacterium]
MIISASRRTDIPAHFGPWFMGRVEAGCFQSVNPFNPKQVSTWSLHPADVDAIVFWTKNPEPFLPCLDELDARGYNYYFLFTLNDYPNLFEPGLPPLEERIDTFLELSRRLGNRRVIWRYDPIVVSTMTPEAYHVERLAELASRLGESTTRLIISFLDFYGKVNKRLARLEARADVRFIDLKAEEQDEARDRLCEAIGQIGGDAGLEVVSCAESLNMTRFGIRGGGCIDADLIRDLFGVHKTIKRDRGQRKACLCAKAVDMGVYNTCVTGCVYCYANLEGAVISETVGRHDPQGPGLIRPKAPL